MTFEASGEILSPRNNGAGRRLEPGVLLSHRHNGVLAGDFRVLLLLVGDKKSDETRKKVAKPNKDCVVSHECYST